MIRLPDQMKKKEKIDKMNELIDDLDLSHCINTGKSVLQIKRAERDNLGIIFDSSPLKGYCTFFQKYS